MIYGLGTAMGWDVHAVKQSSVWEFFSAWQGYVEANTPKQDNKLTEEQKDALWERLQQLDAPSGATLSTQTYWLDGRHLVPAGVVTFEAP